MSDTDTDTITKTRSTEDISVDEPGKYKVVMHNDDQTTFEIVIAILQLVFYKTPEEAGDIATAIHNSERGIVGVYSKEIAEEKTEEAIRFARGHGFPLVVTAEPE